MTTLSIVSVKFIFVMLVFLKTIYFDFFKFNDNLFILSHSSIFSQFRIDFCFGESNHIILVWRINIAIESGVICVHDKVEVAAC